MESKTKSAKGLILENKRESQYYCKRSNVLDNKRKSKTNSAEKVKRSENKPDMYVLVMLALFP